ncbi:endo alpha-1,4 polygalactosaminidase [Hahella sp. NBU794]|uniref:endo alpha-1,4 polygalactosaminidase n=1 Tax=Hahella sp. NBU794 TaxID=3422590 RepID=UPI003D6F4D5A
MTQKLFGPYISANPPFARRRLQPALAAATLACALGLTACNSDAGTRDNETKATNSSSASNAGSQSAANIWRPKPGTTWMWQLQNYGSMNMNLDVTAYDIDLFEGSGSGSNSLIRQLKNKGKRVICYFSAGTREDWRPDADQFAPGSVIADGGMQDWPGETWLNIGNKSALEQTIKPIMEARLDLARDAGCDAVEPDNVDGYTNRDETHGAISAADQLAYNKWLAEAAHARGLSIGLKNDVDQLQALAPYFDFAVNEQCYAWGNECVAYENTFLSAGKAVFNQEYYKKGEEGIITKEQFLGNACSYFVSAGISALWRQSFELNGGTSLSCPGAVDPGDDGDDDGGDNGGDTGGDDGDNGDNGGDTGGDDGDDGDNGDNGGDTGGDDGDNGDNGGDTGGDDGDNGDTVGDIWTPTPGTTWMWQLQRYGSINMDLDVDAYDIDLFEGSENGANSLIHQLKNKGKKVICYFSAGTREDWRPDANQFTEGSVIADGDMDDWPGETWLNIGNQTALEQTIKPIMEARLDLARDAGCDAVEPDNMDGYDNRSETHGEISAADQLAYNIWIAQAAHARGLSVGLKNDVGQAEELVAYFDFAVNEQCFAYEECEAYEDTFLNANKAVFNQEYYTDGDDGEISKRRFLRKACPYFESVGISGLWAKGYSLNGRNVVACESN